MKGSAAARLRRLWRSVRHAERVDDQSLTRALDDHADIAEFPVLARRHESIAAEEFDAPVVAEREHAPRRIKMRTELRERPAIPLARARPGTEEDRCVRVAARAVDAPFAIEHEDPPSVRHEHESARAPGKSEIRSWADAMLDGVEEERPVKRVPLGADAAGDEDHPVARDRRRAFRDDLRELDAPEARRREGLREIDGLDRRLVVPPDQDERLADDDRCVVSPRSLERDRLGPTMEDRIEDAQRAAGSDGDAPVGKERRRVSVERVLPRRHALRRSRHERIEDLAVAVVGHVATPRSLPAAENEDATVEEARRGRAGARLEQARTDGKPTVDGMTDLDRARRDEFARAAAEDDEMPSDDRGAGVEDGERHRARHRLPRREREDGVARAAIRGQ